MDKLIGVEGARLLGDQRDSSKSGGGLFSPDKQKMNGFEGALCLLSHLTFDLEGLATATRQMRQLRAQSVEMAHRTPPGKRAPETEINSHQNNCTFLQKKVATL